MTLPRPCLCLVTDRHRLAPGARTVAEEVSALERQIEQALEAGVDLIHLRERDLEARVLTALAGRIAGRASRSTRVVINDRADVALASGAGGVHLRSDGPPCARVRSLAPAGGWLVGRSIHSAPEAAAAEADYLLFGTVFPGGSKPAGAPRAGLDRLRLAASAAGVPVLAIGGVVPATAGGCLAAGAGGIAAIGAFVDAADPGGSSLQEAVRAFRAAFDGVK